MKIAVIDMGTNTFHLILVDVSYDHYQITYRERIAVKIGKDGISQGYITQDATNRALGAIKDFKSVIDRHDIEEVYATATSAIRNARNGHEVLTLIETETGITSKIITGEEEAQLIYYGVLSALHIGDDPTLIMDIGGGSIEFIIANQEEIFWLHSYELGGQRMIDRFHHSDPIDTKEIELLEEYLFENLSGLYEACHKYRPQTLIGCSGTFDTISDIYQHRKGSKNDPNWTELPFEFSKFGSIYQEIISKSKEERLKIPGMIPMRVDMIVVAMILIKFSLTTLNIKNLRISAYALKEGVLLKTIDSLKKERVLKPG